MIDLDKLNKVFPKAYFDMACGCVEPGYDDNPVILANWNHVPDKVFTNLESKGFSCEWLDEWITCSDCGKAFRTSPDSWEWQMSGVILDGEALCLECLDPIEYMESLENNPKKALTTAVSDKYNPTKYGYKLVNDDFESGWYGTTDNPVEVLKQAQQKQQGKYLFAITSQGQFAINFALYRKVIAQEITKPENLIQV